MCSSNVTKRSGAQPVKRQGSALPLLDVALGEAALFEILLVIFLCSPKGRSGNDLRYDRSLKRSGALQTFLGCSGGCLLLRSVIENHRPVLSSLVGTLAVQGRRIMVLPKDAQEVVVGCL